MNQQDKEPLYHLLGLNAAGAVVSYDGPHDSPSGVAKALHLYEQLGLKDESLKYVMAKTSPVPQFKGKVNKEAIGILAPLIKKRKASL